MGRYSNMKGGQCPTNQLPEIAALLWAILMRLINLIALWLIAFFSTNWICAGCGTSTSAINATVIVVLYALLDFLFCFLSWLRRLLCGCGDE